MLKRLFYNKSTSCLSPFCNTIKYQSPIKTFSFLSQHPIVYHNLRHYNQNKPLVIIKIEEYGENNSAKNRDNKYDVIINIEKSNDNKKIAINYNQNKIFEDYTSNDIVENNTLNIISENNDKYSSLNNSHVSNLENDKKDKSPTNNIDSTTNSSKLIDIEQKKDNEYQEGDIFKNPRAVLILTIICAIICLISINNGTFWTLFMLAL